MDLNSMFPKGKAFKTEALARKRLNQFEAKLGDDNHLLQNLGYHSVIIPVQQGYQVIIIMRHDCKIPCLWFVDAGFCVTN